MNPALLTRRTFIGACNALAASLLAPTPASARDSALPVPSSLQKVAGLAAAIGEPLVLLVSLPGCPFCELVRRNYLLPMRADDGLAAWQINVADSTTRLVDFNGQPTNAASQATALKATFTPTILFLGTRGQELAERLVGIASPDFFGTYLDERLAKARQAVTVRKQV